MINAYDTQWEDRHSTYRSEKNSDTKNRRKISKGIIELKPSSSYEGIISEEF